MTAETTKVADFKTRFVAEARRFASEPSGATAIEYAIIAAMLSIVIIGAVAALGEGVTGLFQRVANAFSS
ncbi:MAG: Flp family type IVb pilin [Methyloceanibacter sp.]|jgi:pilus assembly protein Flp/PilA|uniref:Flp family type IVb pilin n=1 Tax=Methyloceanibacter sp. TaxID=1965321 RepID=UPI0035618B2E